MGDKMGIKISGVGCSLLDLIYSDIDFRSRAFRRLSSQKPGDGGLIPGGLVFVEDLERFANTDLKTIMKTITAKSSPDAMNLGGPAIAALVNTSQRCQHTVHNLICGHLQGKDKRRFICVKCGMLSQVHRKGCFTHRWTCCDNNQIAGLKAGGHLI